MGSGVDRPIQSEPDSDSVPKRGSEQRHHSKGATGLAKSGCSWIRTSRWLGSMESRTCLAENRDTLATCGFGQEARLPASSPAVGRPGVVTEIVAQPRGQAGFFNEPVRGVRCWWVR